MTLMIAGLLLFLGTHSLRVLADPWRTRMIGRYGAGSWKGIYALVSLLGFVLILWGFDSARASSTMLHAPPAWLRHLNAAFTLLAFVLVTAAYVPRNHLRAVLGHPMLAGVQLWALGHLLATGSLRDAILFGAILVWAVAAFMSSRRRERRLGTRYPPGVLGADLMTLVIGVAAWAVFATWLHLRWIGVDPLA